MKINRRTFLAGAVAAGTAALIPEKNAEASGGDDSYATLIDLTKCDGCEGKKMPVCVAACRAHNKDKFPKPDPEKIMDYWPQKKHEDWSDKKHITDRLTPYNWLAVQHVEVETENGTKKVSVPRRCMHCDNPPCVKVCPFSANTKLKEGPVYIKESMCLGGAKCRTVCPWHIPQRQAGVGIYTMWTPEVPAGGGVMYKCDMCLDNLKEGKPPACVSACPNGAMTFGKRSEIVALANKLKDEYNGYIYGDTQNGGTSTLYVSDVSFEQIDKAIVKQAKNPKKALRMHNPENMLERSGEWLWVSLAAPLAGALAAFGSTIKKRAEKDESE